MAHPILRATEEPTPWQMDVLLVESPSSGPGDVTSLLEGVGHRVRFAATAREAIEIARTGTIDILLVDVDTPNVDAFLLLNQVRSMLPDTHVILASGEPSIDDAVAATKARADYLLRPLTSRNLLGPVAAVARRREIQVEMFESRSGGEPLVGGSPLIKSLKRDARIIAQADGPVLITGEMGTGKQLVARMIHAEGTRAERGLFQVDCSLSAPDEVCREIFGPGGTMDQAVGGVVIFDHVEALSSIAQAKLMNGLESGRFEHGATDIRVIAVSRSDLRELADKGAFRAELLCRLGEHRLEVPSLRRRRDDIPRLVEYFCHKHSRSANSVRVSPDVWAVLTAASFPGNVRQLELTIKHALTFCRDESDLRVEHLPTDLRANSEHDWVAKQPECEVAPLDDAVTAFEHQYLCQTLARTGGNRTRAASMLGISRKSLWAKLKRFEARRPLLTVGWVR